MLHGVSKAGRRTLGEARKALGRIASGLLLAAMGLPACSIIVDGSVEGGVGNGCSSAADCQGSGALCDSTLTCTLPCVADDDCPDGSSCASSFCRASGQGALGAVCAAGTDCKSSLCAEGLCATTCQATPDCAGGSVCIEGICQLTLTTGFLFDNDVSSATYGFALAHDVGRKAAVEALPWLDTRSSENNDNDTVSASIDGLVNEGADVVVVTTNRFATEALAKAKANPDVRFLTFATTSKGDNFVSYDVRIHQAWRVAGYVAGSFETGGKIGFLGAVPFPEVVRQLNAFTVGVLEANPAARVEVVWANSFVPDAPTTRKLVDYLVEGGNRVIVNRLGEGTSVSYVQELVDGGKDLFSMAHDNPNACDLAPATCLGSPYYNWGPLYVKMLDAIHRGTFDPGATINESIEVDASLSTFHFALNDVVPGLSGLKPALVAEIGKLVGDGGEDRTFGDGFCVTDPAQRPDKPACSAKGEIVDDAELSSMCWLVKGVVQPSNPEDPTSALVDARAPDGTVVWPPKWVDPSSITKPSCQ